MVVVRKVANDATQVRIYVKGAPEYVIPLCSDTFDSEMNPKEFDEDDRTKVEYDIVACLMAREGMKTLSYAYKQIPMDDFNMLLSSHHVESEEFRNEIEADLVYLGSFGLEDKVRGGVQEAIQLIRYGAIVGDQIDKSKGARNQVNVRMITGDHLETAIQVAVEVGILSETESKI